MAHLARDPNARPDGRTAADLANVLPMSASVQDGRLLIGGVDTVELARSRGTALYVMDEGHIREQLRRYKAAFAAQNVTARVAYAGKAFLTYAMCELLAEEGCWLDVSSGGELALALRAGFDPGHVIVHGNNKTLRELEEAVSASVGRIAVDCREELERVDALAGRLGRVQPIYLRIKPGVVADTHEYIQTGAEDSKFGFSISDGTAMEAVRTASAMRNVELKGLHAHIGSQIFSLESYACAISVMVGFFAALHRELGVLPDELDIGGGLGIAYQAGDRPSSIENLAAVLSSELRHACAQNSLGQPCIVVEPGRSVVANAGVTLYTVGSVKHLEGIRTYVAIDGGMTDNIRTALYGARYEAILANKADEARDAVVTLAGKHCESGDVVAIDASLQNPQPGDIVCVLATGAYCHTMASNYNRQPRPAVYFVAGGKARLVIRRESYEDLQKCDVSERESVSERVNGQASGCASNCASEQASVHVSAQNSPISERMEAI
jgi:diaminopimelate decarboxylase